MEILTMRTIALLLVFGAMVASLFAARTVATGQTISPNRQYLPLIRSAPSTPTPTATPRATATPLPTATATPTVTPMPTPLRFVCDHDYYNCSSFRWQEEAQEVFEYCIDQGADDIHKLDQNNDGIACNALPSRPLYNLWGN